MVLLVLWVGGTIMTGGKLTPKADDRLRKNLTKRAKEHIALVNKIVPDRLLKSPSQKKSEAAKKKEARRAEAHEASCSKAAATLMFDCYTCPKQPCGSLPEICDAPMILERCGKCGQPVRHYVDANLKWDVCQMCRKKDKEPVVAMDEMALDAEPDPFDEEADEEFDRMVNDRDDWQMKGYQR